MKIIGNENNKERLFHWELTHYCNYKCEYCTQPYKKEHDDRYLETAKVIRDVILPVYKPNKIEILGGEISILDPELCKIISDNDIYTSLMTNGSNLDWFLPFSKRENYTIFVSIHESQEDIDNIINNILKYTNRLNIEVSMVLTKYNINSVKYAKKALEKNGIKFFVQKECKTEDNELDQALINHKVKIDGEDKNITSEFVGKPCKCKPRILHLNGFGKLCSCHCSKGQLLPKHIVEHTKEEIEKAINNVINNPIIDCDSACYPCVPTIVQYFEEKYDN